MLKCQHSPYTKIHPKWIKDLNIRSESIKLLEENICRTLPNINCSNIFGDMSPKAKEIKTKINKWDLIKYKIFCTAKETIDKTKKKSFMKENICKIYDRQAVDIQNI